MAEGSTSMSASHESLLQALTNRGWCFGDVDKVKALITAHSFLHGDAVTVDSVESELCNTDLRSIGGKSLPDPTLLRNSSHLLAPKVLQIASVRDVSRSSFADGSKSRRLLKMILTDGRSQITAIEYSSIDSLPDDVVPGTKVRLEKKAIVRSGIVCLSPDVVTILGGVVQSLYEEWQMNQKYSGFSRSSLRLSREGGGGGPPAFEKFHTGGSKRGYVQNESHGNPEMRSLDRKQTPDIRADGADEALKAATISQRTDEKPSTSESRPKEVVDYIPIQNQAAAQKLLQKMSHPTQKHQQQRGQRYKGKGKDEEKPVFTLDEWERSKTGVNYPSGIEEASDEDLAWQLQNQFDLEDQVQMNRQKAAAENIKLKMFRFERDDGGEHGGARGRGRGRGRGRMRGSWN